MFLAVILAGAGRPNPEKCRGRPVRRATCACRWRRVLRDDGTAVFTERSLPGRCHSERCDPNTYVPLRSDALNGYTREGRVDRRIGGCPAPHREMFHCQARLQITTPLHLPDRALEISAIGACGPCVLTPHRLLLQLQGLIVHNFLRPYQIAVR